MKLKAKLFGCTQVEIPKLTNSFSINSHLDKKCFKTTPPLSPGTETRKQLQNLTTFFSPEALIKFTRLRLCKSYRFYNDSALLISLFKLSVSHSRVASPGGVFNNALWAHLKTPSKRATISAVCLAYLFFRIHLSALLAFWAFLTILGVFAKFGYIINCRLYSNVTMGNRQNMM